MMNNLTKLLIALSPVWVVLSLTGCDQPELMPWHTEVLETEFSADSSLEVNSFEDYLVVEDAVFEELQDRIYKDSHSSPDQTLERYTRGSLADPEQRTPNWNRSFEMPVDSPRAGVLLLHGMSDSPYSLRALGEILQQHGYYVIGLRMPGHGTLPSGLLNLQWRDMAAVVRFGMTHLAQKVVGQPVYIVGYSTGAALALDYTLTSQQDSTQPTPARLVLISPAIGVSPAAALAKWTRRLSYFPGLHQLAWLDILPEFDPYKYNSFTTNAAEQVYNLTVSVAERIASRSDKEQPLPPMLIFKSTVDATVSNNAVVDRLLSKLSTDLHELVVFDINRFAANASLLKSDPGPFTARMIADEQLPFALTLVTNSDHEHRAVTAFSKEPFESGASAIEPLGLNWPRGVFSLSHVALPFPPDDTLYGQHPPADKHELFLGQQALQGERGVLRISGDFLLRLRHNPFYAYQQARILEWLE
jgi:alpha-beta hydrolase superfamily lysophospholipase